MIRLTEKEASRLNKGAPRKRQHKFNAIKTTVDGINFPSKHEAEVYRKLKAQRDAGAIHCFLRQVPLHLPGGTRLVVDFLALSPEALKHVRFIDAKGMLTDVFKVKRREAEFHFGIKVECV